MAPRCSLSRLRGPLAFPKLLGAAWVGRGGRKALRWLLVASWRGTGPLWLSWWLAVFPSLARESHDAGSGEPRCLGSLHGFGCLQAIGQYGSLCGYFTAGVQPQAGLPKICSPSLCKLAIQESCWQSRGQNVNLRCGCPESSTERSKFSRTRAKTCVLEADRLAVAGC